MNFAVKTFLCNILDFRQFTVDSSENNTENNKNKFFFFSRLTFYINFGVYVVVKFCFSFIIIFGYGNVC